MATERELELAKQILAKLTEMETTLDKIDGKLGKIDCKMDDLSGEETSTSVDGKLGNVKSVYKDLQNTFTKGFADVHEGLAKIKEVKQIKKNGKQVH